jgi:hypothetical protein
LQNNRKQTQETDRQYGATTELKGKRFVKQIRPVLKEEK